MKPFAFVLMPFDAAFDDIYKLGIQATAHDKGVVAERVDEQIFSETMLERIYHQIDTADFIIADMTGKNPNVFYEVGYAHAKGKLCTLVTQDANDIPFDLRHHRHLVYGGSIQTLKRLLATEIDWLLSEVERKRSALLEVTLRSAIGNLTKSDWRHVGEAELHIDLQNGPGKRPAEIEAIYLHTGKGWTYYQNGEECPSTTSTLNDYTMRHFLKPPLARLSPGSWAQIRAVGKRTLWNKFGQGAAIPQDTYRIVGHATVEITTAEGTMRQLLNLEVDFDDIPF